MAGFWNFRKNQESTVIKTNQDNIESINTALNIINSEPISEIFFTKWGYSSFMLIITDTQEVYLINNNEGKLELTNEIKGDYLTIQINMAQINKSIEYLNLGDRVTSLNYLNRSVKIPIVAKIRAIYILLSMWEICHSGWINLNFVGDVGLNLKESAAQYVIFENDEVYLIFEMYYK